MLRFNDPRVDGIKDVLHFLFASSLTEGALRLEFFQERGYVNIIMKQRQILK